MEAASLPWRPIGELLIARGLITEDDLEQALAQQAETGRRLGEILVARQVISSPDLTEALMAQLGEEVAKQDGFGSGLWAEVQRRAGRGESRVARFDHTPAPFGSALGEAFAGTTDEPPAVPAFEVFEDDFADLRAELGVPAATQSPVGPPPIAEPDLEHGESPELTSADVVVDSLRMQLARTQAELAAEREGRGPLREQVSALELELGAEREAHAETRARLAGLEADAAAEFRAEETPSGEYLCFVPGHDGYRLVSASGPIPGRGDRYELDGAVFVVAKTVCSPLPGDPRLCAHLQLA